MCRPWTRRPRTALSLDALALDAASLDAEGRLCVGRVGDGGRRAVQQLERARIRVLILPPVQHH